MSSKLNSLLKKTGKFLSDNSPAILTGLGIAGYATAVVVTAKQAPKAKKALEDARLAMATEQEVDGIYRTKKQIIFEEAKVLAPYYAPIAGLCVVSTACLLCSYKVSTNKTAALATAYELSERARIEYSERVKEKIGEKAEHDIRQEMQVEEAKREEANLSGPQDSAIICTGNGSQLFFDWGTHRFFRSSVIALQDARTKVSQKIFTDEYASCNELYYFQGIGACGLGNFAGWSNYDLHSYGEIKLIDMSWDNCFMTDWGETCAIVEYTAHDRYAD